MDRTPSEEPGDSPTAVATASTSAATTEPPASLQVDDQEKPGRELRGWINTLVACVAFAVAILTIWQVFRPLPQGSQYYLIVFLAGSLPLVYLVYRSGMGSSTRTIAPASSTGYWPPSRCWCVCIPFCR